MMLDPKTGMQQFLPRTSKGGGGHSVVEKHTGLWLQALLSKSWLNVLEIQFLFIYFF